MRSAPPKITSSAAGTGTRTALPPGREPRGTLARLVEVPAVLDQLGAECPHRGVLLGAVAARHEDHAARPGARAGEREALAVVAARRAAPAANPGPRLERVEQPQPAAHLERAGRRVVLVLYPELEPRARVEKRPGVLRRRRNHRVHPGGRALELRKAELDHVASAGF